MNTICETSVTLFKEVEKSIRVVCNMTSWGVKHFLCIFEKLHGRQAYVYTPCFQVSDYKIKRKFLNEITYTGYR